MYVVLQAMKFYTLRYQELGQKKSQDTVTLEFKSKIYFYAIYLPILLNLYPTVQ